MRRLVSVVLAILFMAVAAVNVSAENREGAFTLSPHLGGYIFEGDQNINSDPVYGIGLGYNLTERISLEGVFDWVDTDSKSSTKSPDVEANIYRIDGLYHFILDNNKDFLPYLSAGGGAITLNKDPGETDTDLLVNYGLGIKYFITKTLAVRGEARHIIDVEDKSNNNLIYTLGLTALFGGKEKTPPPAPQPKDSDGDGVFDDADKCPGTPAGTPVDSNGCPKDSDGDGVYDHLDKCPGTPAGTAVDSVGCPKVTVTDKDSDGDGVYDSMDKCPDTPAGAPVDATGCPLDSDGDGVYDYMDKCPGTLSGITVDSQGCPVPIKEKVTIELSVEFDFDRAKVKNIYNDHIQKVANFLKTYPDTMAEIEGHTDSVGSDQYNLKLSQERADNVKQHLVEFGLDESRLKTVGYGETRPIADNKTEEGRARNRRVSAVISTVVTK